MPIYQRNSKHKSWLQPFDPDASLCPAWTHDHAQALLNESIVDASESRRFASAEGMAFVARVTRDDIWHGYPVPWSEVPEAVREQMLTAGVVTRRQIKRLFSSEALAEELDA